MNIAAIDIGSNTVLLLVAKVDLKRSKLTALINRIETPRLGKGLKPNHPINDSSIELLVNVFKNYQNFIQEYDCQVVIAVATNAMRIATNAKDILELIEAEFGINIKIISGEEEAKYSFLGAISSSTKDEEILVVDIGGGSSEIIHGFGDEIDFCKSYPIGVVLLSEKFIRHYPPNANELMDIHNFILQIISSDLYGFLNTTKIIAVAGTPTCLSAMKQNLISFSEDKIDKSFLTRLELGEFLDEFRLLAPEKILNKYGSIVKGREDVIQAGTIILSTLLDILGKKEVTVSSRGLRYGVIMDYLKKNKC